MKLSYIYVVVNRKEGYAVIAYSTYVEARDWKLRHSTPDNYRIDFVSLHTSA